MIQTGDFLFYPVTANSPWYSKVIAWGEKIVRQAPTNEDYSHVAVVGPDLSHQYEAVFPGGVQNNRVRVLDAEAWRIKGITPAEVKLMMDYADRQIKRKTKYDWLEIITFGKFKLGGTWICSELAYNMALEAGYILGEVQNLQSPDDDAASKKLVRIA